MIARLVGTFWFRALVSAAVLAFLVTSLDWRDSLRALAAVDPRFFLAAIVVDAAARAAMISRWFVLLRSRGETVSVWEAARIFFVSSFIGTALPAGGADVTRAYALSRHTDDGRAAVASVAVDRLLGVAALMGLALLGLVFARETVSEPLGTVVVGVSAAIVVVIAMSFWADRLLRVVVPAAVAESRLGAWLIDAADNVGAYRARPGVLTAVLAQSLLVQGLRVLEVFLLAVGLGLEVPLGYYVIFMPIGLLTFMLPISVAGIGIPQGVVVWLLRPAGVPDALSFALSTLVVLLGMLGTLPGLYLHLRSRGDR